MPHTERVWAFTPTVLSGDPGIAETGGRPLQVAPYSYARPTRLDDLRTIDTSFGERLMIRLFASAHDRPRDAKNLACLLLRRREKTPRQ